MVWGLTPHQIRSLVGCSSVIEIFQQVSTSTPACEKLWAWGIERSVSQQRATEWQYLDRTARSSFTTLIAAFGAQS